MKKRNTLAVILAMLLVCGSASVYAFGGMNKGNCIRNTATQTKVRCEMAVKAPELTEEQKTEMIEAQRAKLAKMLEDGKITQEEYDEYVAKLDAGEFSAFGKGGNGFGMKEKPKAPELTEEQKTEMIEAQRAKLAKMLEDGKITQEEYDEYVAKLDAGEFSAFGKGGKGFSMKEKPEAPELTEEQIAEMIEAQRAKLAKMLEDGKITQEEYDEYVAKLDAGEFVHIGNGKDFFAREGNGKTPDANKSKKNFFSGTAMTKPLHGTDSKINNIGRRR